MASGTGRTGGTSGRAGTEHPDEGGARRDSREIVFASANAGKIAELHQLLSPLGWRVVAQAELGVGSVEETATTFVENALLKARHACRETGRPAIADDSGLEVDALGGAPGLYSSRFAAMAGRGEGDAANNAWLLERLAHLDDPARRTARFRSVVVRLRHADDPAPLICQGTWEGDVLPAHAGGGGFGYDPVFRNRDTGTAASTLERATKNRLSHRGKAVALLVALLAEEAGRAGPDMENGTENGTGAGAGPGDRGR